MLGSPSLLRNGLPIYVTQEYGVMPCWPADCARIAAHADAVGWADGWLEQDRTGPGWTRLRCAPHAVHYRDALSDQEPSVLLQIHDCAC
jgi:hypothetical protein